MTTPDTRTSPPVLIIGGGPAGLMAAEALLAAGYGVDLYDAMPSVGRKFLLAGIGGLNITHSENVQDFCGRYAERQTDLQPSLNTFGADAVRHWCASLGIDTFIGTSGRVFPREMKAAPLLRAWLARLKQQGLHIHSRHRWLGWDEQRQLQFQTPHGLIARPYQAAILALGGGSWKKLGSDGAWMPVLSAQGVPTKALQPSNCGFLVDWSEHLRRQFAGAPLKSVTLSFTALDGRTETRMGELILTEKGVEGSLVYAFSARVRDTINAQGSATFYLDLCPHHSHAELAEAYQRKAAKKSLGAFLKGSLKLDAAKAALYFEAKTSGMDSLKAIPVTVTATTPMDEAISTAGGVPFEALDENLMVKALPGVFCAGEMLDWEAPTGGYLLTACLATGRQAGVGAVNFLIQQKILPKL